MEKYWEGRFKTLKERYNINSNEDIDFYEMEQAFFDLFNYFEIFEKVFDKIENVVTKGIEMCKETSLSHEDTIILWERSLKDIQDVIEKGNKKWHGDTF